jgi:hypothetical protein
MAVTEVIRLIFRAQLELLPSPLTTGLPFEIPTDALYGISAEGSSRKAVESMNGISEKFTVYRTLYTLNQGFEIILLACTRLESLGVLRDDQLRSCKLMTEELRALANYEVTEALTGREERDCVRLQNLRAEWETRLRVQGEHMPRPIRPQPKARPSKRTRKSTRKTPGS